MTDEFAIQGRITKTQVRAWYRRTGEVGSVLTFQVDVPLLPEQSPRESIANLSEVAGKDIMIRIATVQVPLPLQRTPIDEVEVRTDDARVTLTPADGARLRPSRKRIRRGALAKG